MSYSLFKKSFIMFLFHVSIILALTNLYHGSVLAAKEVHHFKLTSGFKDATDMRPREILFMPKYPGLIKIDASWTPADKKLTITLYDQEKNSLVAKKDKSPVNIVYEYSREHYKKSKTLGSSFMVEISQSPYKSINGTVEIETPDKVKIEEEEHDEVRGPYGVFKKEKDSDN